MKSPERRGICIALLLTLLFLAGCEKKVTTVADDITAEDGTVQYTEVERFAVKEPVGEDLTEIGFVALYIPDNYVRLPDTPGMYVSDLYPLDSSNIYYTRADGFGDGAVSRSLSLAQYKTAVEEAYAAEGEAIELVVDEFDSTFLEGVPSYKIRSHYSIGERDLEMLAYLILGTDTYVITYTQVSDDELFVDFLTDEGNLKLVKEVSGREP